MYGGQHLPLPSNCWLFFCLPTSRRWIWNSSLGGHRPLLHYTLRWPSYYKLRKLQEAHEWIQKQPRMACPSSEQSGTRLVEFSGCRQICWRLKLKNQHLHLLLPSHRQPFRSLNSCIHKHLRYFHFLSCTDTFSEELQLLVSDRRPIVLHILAGVPCRSHWRTSCVKTIFHCFYIWRTRISSWKLQALQLNLLNIKFHHSSLDIHFLGSFLFDFHSNSALVQMEFFSWSMIDKQDLNVVEYNFYKTVLLD